MVLESVGDAIVEEVATASVNVAADIISELGKIGNWLQALGIIVVLWIIIQIINIILNQKKKKHLKSIESKLNNLENKIDQLSLKKSRKIRKKK